LFGPLKENISVGNLDQVLLKMISNGFKADLKLKDMQKILQNLPGVG
jgi:hypothetical protein